MNHAPHKGFTLVETMVAITILAFAFVGPFTAVQTALTNSYVSRDQLTGALLAQEGLEYIRSIRDNNYLAGRAWTDGFSGTENNRNQCYGENPSGYCTVDPTVGDFHNESDAMEGYSSGNTENIAYLYLSSANLYNQQGSGAETRFKRTVQLQSISDTELLVTVVVSWQTGAGSYSVTVTDTLHDWL